jgi:hypothetical protein
VASGVADCVGIGGNELEDELLDEELLEEEELDEDEELDELLEQRSLVRLSLQKGSIQRVLLSTHPQSSLALQGTQVLPLGLMLNPQSMLASLSCSLNSSQPHSSRVPFLVISRHGFAACLCSKVSHGLEEHGTQLLPL